MAIPAQQRNVSHVSGRIVDSSGAAPSAVVLEMGGLERTDRNGYFRLELAPGNYELKARVYGFEPLVRPIRVEAGKDLELGVLTLKVVPSDNEAVRARWDVRISGHAHTFCGHGGTNGGISGAFVWLRVAGVPGITAVTRTTTNGRFVFPNVPARRYEVEIEGHWEYRPVSRPLDASDGMDLDADTGFEMTFPGLCDESITVAPLPRRVHASGVVVDDRGNAIRHARVALVQSLKRPETTRKDGAFMIDIPPEDGRGTVEFRSEANGFRPLRRIVHVPQPIETILLGEVVLRRSNARP